MTAVWCQQLDNGVITTTEWLNEYHNGDSDNKGVRFDK